MGARRYVPGFQLLNELQHKRSYGVGSGVAIARGDALILTSGYLALATTLQSTTPVFCGIALEENTAAEASANDVFKVLVAPPLMQYQWMVPCEATGVLAATDVGTVRDIETEDGLDEGDTVTAGLGFFIDEIDISTAALAASATFGFAIGHFESVYAS